MNRNVRYGLATLFALIAAALVVLLIFGIARMIAGTTNF